MFLVIQSAEEIYTLGSLLLQKIKSLVCSKNLSTTLITSIFSLMPLTPGIKQQIPRTIICIFTPALLASYNLSTILKLERLFIFNLIYAGFPAFTFCISKSINLKKAFSV